MTYDWEDGKTFAGIIGRVLTGLAVSKDTTGEDYGEHELRLTFADGEHYVTTEGDCCSESWWADILGASSAFGGVVVDVRELELPEPNDDRSRQEVDRAYGYEIRTTRGVITLAFRNSSNGYYGGWAYDLTDPPKCEWHEITTNDWRA